MDSIETFRNVGIIGYGMVGGSIADLIYKKSPNTRVTIVETNAEYREIAFDRHPASPVDMRLEAVVGCDLVIVATYVGDIAKTVMDVLSLVGFQGIVLDTGSVKAPIIRDILEESPYADRYVPGHPMAGRNEPGPMTSSAEIMDGQTFLTCQHDRVSLSALERVDGFLRSISFRTHRVSAEDHDSILSISSHLPHILAYSLGGQLGDLGNRAPLEDLEALSGRSIRTMVDFASPNSRMWEQILQANRTAILSEGHKVKERLEGFLAAIEQDDLGSLRNRFAEGASGRGLLLK